MTDFYGNEIQIGDECIRYSGWTSFLEKTTVLGIEREDKILILNSFEKEVYTSDKKLIDITAMERKLYSERIINSVKTLDIKDDDTLVVSLIPNQLSLNESQTVFDQMKKVFPNNKVLVTIGLEVNIEDGDSDV